MAKASTPSTPKSSSPSTYAVLHKIRHDGKWFLRHSRITLTDAQAEPLLSSGFIEELSGDQEA